jgi:hypothetical protein|tara:strand:- start:1111 stop:1554 length:444 start_codon:yes stop_codon:yes gene_type:complete
MTIQRKLTFSNYYNEVILDEIALVYNVDRDTIFTGSRKKNIIFAKRMFIYILRSMFGLTLYEIAHITNLHHSSVIHHSRKFEFFKKSYIEENKDFKQVEAKILSVEADEMIRVLEEKKSEIEKELTKLYNIKKEKNVRKEREGLLTE